MFMRTVAYQFFQSHPVFSKRPNHRLVKNRRHKMATLYTSYCYRLIEFWKYILIDNDLYPTEGSIIISFPNDTLMIL